LFSDQRRATGRRLPGANLLAWSVKIVAIMAAYGTVCLAPIRETSNSLFVLRSTNRLATQWIGVDHAPPRTRYRATVSARIRFVTSTSLLCFISHHVQRGSVMIWNQKE
jgi:hypothetical protein